MQTEEEVESEFDDVLDYIDRLGDEILNTGEGRVTSDESGEEVYLKAVNVREASYDCYYTVRVRNNYEGAVITYSYDLLGHLEEFLQTEEGKSVFELEHISDDDSESAAYEILNRVSEGDMGRLRFQLHDRISNPMTFSHLDTSDDILTGFTIGAVTFTQEPDYRLSDFYETTTAVCSTGEIGSRFVSNAFAIQISDEESAEEFSLSFDPEDIYI